MLEERKAYIELHIAVLLFGFTAILGDLINLQAITLVWWRVFITSISLLFFIRFGRKLKHVPRNKILPFMLIGCIVGLHWVCFYGSIKLANASVSLICMATTSVFTSLLEPLIIKRRIQPLEIIIGLVIIPSMGLVISELDLTMKWGVVVGLMSAFLASLFGVLNKKYIEVSDPYSITFIELSSAWLLLSLVFIVGYSYFDFSQFVPPTAMDWVYIIILALLCTTLAYVLSLRSLKHLSAFASNLVVNLEPLYGIVLAAILLKEYEQLTFNFYLGGALIIMAVLSYPALKKKFNVI